MLLKNLFLCDAATLHPDNTFSVLRGGIFSATIQVPPGAEPNRVPPLKLALVGTIEVEVTETGKQHALEVTLMDMDGRRILPEINAPFQVPPGNLQAHHNILLDLFIQFQKPGTYSFYVNVDGHELGSLLFSVAFAEPQQSHNN
jgi:hypothetical protein